MSLEGSSDTADPQAPEVRPWSAADDPELLQILEIQARADPEWPPDYARGGDLAAWLGAPAALGRWVALLGDHIVGHVGIAPVREGPLNTLWRSALPSQTGALAEICRLVVDPRARRAGASGALTRKAVRAAIEMGFMPVANALADRQASLAMMIAVGWRTVGSTPEVLPGREVVALIPPQKLIDAALARQR